MSITFPLAVSTATSEGSSTTTPRPRTAMMVDADPMSIAMYAMRRIKAYRSYMSYRTILLLRVAQDHDRIDTQRARSGNQTSEQRNQSEQNHDHHKRERIGRRHSKQQALDKTCQHKRRHHADPNPDTNQQESAPEDQFQDRGRLRAERHANPDLARVLGHRVTHHAVNADQREQ